MELAFRRERHFLSRHSYEAGVTVMLIRWRRARCSEWFSTLPAATQPGSTEVSPGPSTLTPPQPSKALVGVQLASLIQPARLEPADQVPSHAGDSILVLFLQPEGNCQATASLVAKGDDLSLASPCCLSADSQALRNQSRTDASLPGCRQQGCLQLQAGHPVSPEGRALYFETQPAPHPHLLLVSVPVARV